MSRRPRNHGHTGGNPPADQGLLNVALGGASLGSSAIASPTDPAETATNGCAKRDNHDALQQMRQVDRSVWAAGEHRPADRDRELRKQPNE